MIYEHKGRVRTLPELQARICFLENRLREYKANAQIHTDTIRAVVRMEEQTIFNLKGQLKMRVDWYMKCIGVQ